MTHCFKQATSQGNCIYTESDVHPHDKNCKLPLLVVAVMTGTKQIVR